MPDEPLSKKELTDAHKIVTLHFQTERWQANYLHIYAEHNKKTMGQVVRDALSAYYRDHPLPIGSGITSKDLARVDE